MFANRSYNFVVIVNILLSFSIVSFAKCKFGDLLTVFDYQKYADSVWDNQTKGYYESGAMFEQTLRDNLEALSSIRLLPRYMVNVSVRDMTTTLLGKNISFPVGIAPSAMQRLAHNQGENGTAKAAASAGTVMILSTLSTISLEQVAKSAPDGIRWFQLYVMKNRTVTKNLVKRAEKAGYAAIVVTADAPILGTRLADLRNKFSLPPNLTLANLEGLASRVNDTSNGSALNQYFQSQIDPALTWKDIAWLKSITKLPIVVKGILAPQDAVLAVQNGASAIIVSNHGGRQLDGAPATIKALPGIVRVVDKKTEVYMDGGVRTGSDVVKALAMGAKAVFIGRPNLYGLSHGGANGSKEVLEILRKELDSTMALIGAATLKDIIPAMIFNPKN